MKSFFIVVVLMLRNGGAQTRIGGAPRAKESINIQNRFMTERAKQFWSIVQPAAFKAFLLHFEGK